MKTPKKEEWAWSRLTEEDSILRLRLLGTDNGRQGTDKAA